VAALFSGGEEMEKPTITICCVCKKMRNADGEWVEAELTAEMERVSHGYCVECKDAALAEIGITS